MKDDFLDHLPDPLRRWIYAIQLHKLYKVIVPFLLGQALGIFHSHTFSLGGFLIGGMFIVTGSIFIVLMNDWYDAPIDTIKEDMFPDHPRRKTIPAGVLTAEQVFNGAMISGLITLVIAIIGGIGLGLGDLAFYALLCGVAFVLYTLPPVKLNYRGGGELMEMLGVGLALPMFSAYLQARTFTIAGIWQFIVPFMIMMLANALVGGIDDEESDRKGGKITVFTLFGNRTGRRLIEVLFIIAPIVMLVFHMLLREFTPIIFLPPILALLGGYYYLLQHSPAAVTNNFTAHARYELILQITVCLAFGLATLLLVVFSFVQI